MKITVNRQDSTCTVEGLNVMHMVAIVHAAKLFRQGKENPNFNSNDPDKERFNRNNLQVILDLSRALTSELESYCNEFDTSLS